MNFLTSNVPMLRSNRPQDPFAVMNEMLKTMWHEGSTNDAFSPCVEVNESKTEYRVSAELPGLAKENVDVQFEGNTLYLKGEKEIHREKNEDEKTHYSERSFGSFMRAIPFGEEVDANKIEADFKNGVLSIRLLKRPMDKKNISSRISIH